MPGNQRRTGLTSASTTGIAAITIDTETAQAARRIGARRAEFRLARADAITRLVRPGTSSHIVLTIDNVRAGACRTRKIASLACRGARAVATNAIHTESTKTFRVGAAHLSNFLLADARAVTRLVCPRTCRNTIEVILSCGEIRTCAHGPGDIARLAGAATRDIATNAVEALTAHALSAQRAGLAVFEFTGAGRIAGHRIGTNANGIVVFTGRDARAYANATHGITYATSRIAGTGATDAVDAEIAHTFG